MLSRDELAKLISFKQIGKLAIILIAMAGTVKLIAWGIGGWNSDDQLRIEALVISCIAIPAGIVVFFAGCVFTQSLYCS